MFSRLRRVFSFVTALILIITAVPFTLTAEAATYNQIVNAATHIIIFNEGKYSTVVRNDVGALSIGVIGWHATNALNLLKEIIARNPSQALNILGATLYNEVITSTYWETRIPSKEEAAAISVLISTTEGRQVQDKCAAEYISGYVRHGQKLGITEPEALVFFADYQNQNGYTGAENFFYRVRNTYGTVNLATLYNGSNKSSRRTRTYNFCAKINWNEFTDSIYGSDDKEIPVISNVTLDRLDETGYAVSCSVEDDKAVTAVYFAIFPKKDGKDYAKWYQQTPVDGRASHTVDISEFSGKSGEYCTYIYAFDEAGNYAYVELNTITVPAASAVVPEFTLAVSSSGLKQKGEEVRWTASAANGSGYYLYEFELFKDNEVIDRRKANDFSDFAYTPVDSAVYKVAVTVTDTLSGKTLTVDSNDVNIFDPIVVKDFSCNETEPQPGQLIYWNIAAEGGEGDFRYSYTLYKDGVAVGSTAWGESASYPHRMLEYGVYHVVANIMDSRMQTISVSSDTVSMLRPLKAEDVQFSSDYGVTGKSVAASVSVTGGTGEYTCDFSIYCNGNEVVKYQTTGLSEFTFRIPQGGTYTASVTVTDADGTVVLASGGELSADETALRGDANCDGKVSAADARFALRCAAMLECPETGLEYAADINGDGRITASDARKILRISAQIEI